MVSFDTGAAEPEILRFIVPRAAVDPTRTSAILLVEACLDDVALTLRTLRRNGVLAEIIVVRDGHEALDWLFVRGAHSGRDPGVIPALVLLDLDLPTLGGWGVLRAMRADPWTSGVPVIVLARASSDVAAPGDLDGPNATLARPIAFPSLLEAARQVGAANALGSDEEVRSSAGFRP
jgi:two-component system response regulator